MKETAIIISGIIFCVMLVLVIGSVSTGAELASLKFWGPQVQEAEREIYEQSPSRVHGMAQRLSNYRQEYNDAVREGDEAKASSVRSVVLLEYGNYDRSLLPDHLVEFLVELESN